MCVRVFSMLLHTVVSCYVSANGHCVSVCVSVYTFEFVMDGTEFSTARKLKYHSPTQCREKSPTNAVFTPYSGNNSTDRLTHTHAVQCALMRAAAYRFSFVFVQRASIHDIQLDFDINVMPTDATHSFDFIQNIHVYLCIASYISLTC